MTFEMVVTADGWEKWIGSQYCPDDTRMKHPYILTCPRSFGPKCKCCGERNMKRIGPLSYACLKSGQIFQLKELLWQTQTKE